MGPLRKSISSRERGAALIIVLAFVVLLTGLAIAYFSRTTSDRPLAHSSFNQAEVDQLAASAMENIIGDLRQEIVNGSTPTSVNGATIYTPTSAANMIPQRSGNAAGVPNLIRRSVSPDNMVAPGLPSRASAVNSATDPSANGRSVTGTRWNSHYLVPKKNTGTADSVPIDAFSAATPDWVFVINNQGATVITSPSNSVIGRYAYAVYDEGGLLDMNVAGYPSGTTVTQSGRKGSVAFADLKALGGYPFFNPDGSGVYQVDKLVGWRNYATTIQSATTNNNFPDTLPSSKAFARNLQVNGTPVSNYYNYVVGNSNGFLSPSPTIAPNDRTDQAFLSRQQLIAFQKALNTNNGNPIANTSQFDPNALQYLSTFSRETNSPSFSPSTPPGSSIDYATLASSATAVNPNFLLRRVGATGFTRFDNTSATQGEPLVKTRFPLSRLAWITYKGPSANLATSDTVYTQLIAAGVTAATIQAGTAANIQTCFGLTFGGTTGSPWTYSHGATNRILRLDEVAAAGREPDFFELLQAAILTGSLGQNTGGGVTGGSVFPDVHMSSKTQHILSIGASIIDQADPDSIPTRIQFIGPNGNTWMAYGVENLPYITQLYPIAGASPNNPTKWATYLLFQLWGPHQNAGASTPSVRLRVDGGVGLFAGGNGETWNTSSTEFINATGQSVTVNPTAFSVPVPLTTANVTSSVTAPGTPGTFTVLAQPTPVPTATP